MCVCVCGWVGGWVGVCVCVCVCSCSVAGGSGEAVDVMMVESSGVPIK